MSSKIAKALADFNQSLLLAEVERALIDDQDPIDLVRELQTGMNLIGERFTTGKYFLCFFGSIVSFQSLDRVSGPKIVGGRFSIF